MRFGATRIIGFFAWLAVSGHLAWMGWHSFRSRVHARRKADHDKKAEQRLAEAATVEQAARTLAPRKPKAVKPAEIAPPRGGALAAAIIPPRLRTVPDDTQ